MSFDFHGPGRREVFDRAAPARSHFRRVATGDAPLWGRLTTFHPGWQPDGQGLSIVRGKNAL
jgi:hypothetical protein